MMTAICIISGGGEILKFTHSVTALRGRCSCTDQVERWWAGAGATGALDQGLRGQAQEGAHKRPSGATSCGRQMSRNSGIGPLATRWALPLSSPAGGGSLTTRFSVSRHLGNRQVASLLQGGARSGLSTSNEQSRQSAQGLQREHNGCSVCLWKLCYQHGTDEAVKRSGFPEA